MKLIVISHPNSVPDEASIINQLFEKGLQILHLRKPDCSEEAIKRLLGEIASHFLPRIALHQNHKIAPEFGISRLHFTEKERAIKTVNELQMMKKNGITLSTSIHDLAQLDDLSCSFDYAFFGPVFNSISKKGYAGIVNRDFKISKKPVELIALGGIDHANLEIVRAMNFDGAAVLGALWEQPEDALINFCGLQGRVVAGTLGDVGDQITVDMAPLGGVPRLKPGVNGGQVGGYLDERVGCDRGPGAGGLASLLTNPRLKPGVNGGHAGGYLDERVGCDRGPVAGGLASLLSNTRLKPGVNGNHAGSYLHGQVGCDREQGAGGLASLLTNPRLKPGVNGGHAGGYLDGQVGHDRQQVAGGLALILTNPGLKPGVNGGHAGGYLDERVGCDREQVAGRSASLTNPRLKPGVSGDYVGGYLSGQVDSDLTNASNVPSVNPGIHPGAGQTHDTTSHLNPWIYPGVDQTHDTAHHLNPGIYPGAEQTHDTTPHLNPGIYPGAEQTHDTAPHLNPGIYPGADQTHDTAPHLNPGIYPGEDQTPDTKPPQIAKLHFISSQTPVLSHLESIQMALGGGCDWIQLRVKDQSQEDVFELAIKAKRLCDEYNAKLIINDYPLIAREIQAYGLHLGLSDMTIPAARKIVGDEMIIGGTANTFEDVLLRIQEGADYVGLGPFRFTNTKQNLSPILGLEGYRRLFKKLEEAHLGIPIIAIGGILEDDVNALKDAGIHGVAMSSALIKSQNIKETVSKIYSILC